MQMKIKKLSISIIVVVIGLILLLQLLSYVNFYSWGKRQTDMIFEDKVADIRSKISSEIAVVENVAFNLCVDNSVQNMIYHSTPSTLIKNVREVSDKMGIYTYNAKNIKYVAIAMNDEIVCSSISNNALDGLFMLSEYAIKDGKDKMENNRYIGHYRHKNKVYFTYLAKIFPLDTGLSTSAGGYTIVLFELGDEIFGETSTEDSGGKMVAVLEDMEGKVLSSNCETAEVGEEYIPQKDKNIISKAVFIDEISSELNIFIPSYAILDIGQPMGIFLILIVIFAIVIFSFLMVTLINTILKSILEIERGAQKISNGDYSYRLKVRGENEISNIATVMNGVLDAVEKYNQERINATNKLFEAKLLQKQAEISHMQNQISPHFLYNSLEQINSLARKSNNGELIAITNIMAATFRYNTDSSKLSTVGEDIDYAFNYFNVINLRREKPISVSYNVSEQILQLPILKMVFQPIFENIIKHAFTHDEEGMITIIGESDQEYATIRIEDNGRGIPAEELEKIRTKLEDTESEESASKWGGIGLLNVHKRLRIYYDDKTCGIDIDSPLGNGTIVSVTIRKPVGEQ